MTGTKESGSCIPAQGDVTSVATSAPTRNSPLTRSLSRRTRRCERAASAACLCVSCAPIRSVGLHMHQQTQSGGFGTTVSTRLLPAGALQAGKVCILLLCKPHHALPCKIIAPQVCASGGNYCTARVTNLRCSCQSTQENAGFAGCTALRPFKC
jgi:hypothetical protein